MAKSQTKNAIAFAKIYPPIGIARVGDSADGYFYGPEFESGGLKRGRNVSRPARSPQASGCPFSRVWLDSEGNCTGEITADQAEITWTVPSLQIRKLLGLSLMALPKPQSSTKVLTMRCNYQFAIRTFGKVIAQPRIFKRSSAMTIASRSKSTQARNL